MIQKEIRMEKSGIATQCYRKKLYFAKTTALCCVLREGHVSLSQSCNPDPRKPRLTSVLLLEPIFDPYGIQFCLLLLCIQLLLHFGGLVVKHNQVAVANIESRKMVASILSIEDVLIDNIRCSLGARCVPESDLPNSPIFSEYVVHLFRSNLKG